MSLTESAVREFRAGDSHRGWRLDHFLAANLPQLSRSRLQALIAEGRVTLTGETIGDPNKRVKPGDLIAITIPPPTPATPQPQHIPLTIVYEDADLILGSSTPELVQVCWNPDQRPFEPGGFFGNYSSELR